MTIAAALRVLGAAVATRVVSSVAAQRGAVLSWCHTAATAPLSASIAQSLVEVVPSSGFIMSQIHGAIADNAPTLQANLTTVLDAKSAALFDWSMKRGTAYAAWLSRGS